MQLAIQDGFGKGLRLNASQVVVYDDIGNPIAVIAKYGPAGGIVIEHASPDRQAHARFEKLLSMMGVRKTVIVDALKPTEPARL